MRRDAIHRFNSRLERIPFTDSQLSPESKFTWAASWVPIKFLSAIWLLSRPLLRSLSPRRFDGDGLALFLVNHLAIGTRRFRYMDLKGGRDRPIDWELEAFYITHCTESELEIFQSLSAS